MSKEEHDWKVTFQSESIPQKMRYCGKCGTMESKHSEHEGDFRWNDVESFKEYVRLENHWKHFEVKCKAEKEREKKKQLERVVIRKKALSQLLRKYRGIKAS